jgi:hypothetical protein
LSFVCREHSLKMSGYPAGHHDQYDQNNQTDSYYQDDQYYDNNYDAHGGHGGHQGGDGYYDESYDLLNATLFISKRTKLTV